MISQARANFPDLRFEVQDVCTMPYREEFDAVFSNAALHWVPRPPMPPAPLPMRSNRTAASSRNWAAMATFAR